MTNGLTKEEQAWLLEYQICEHDSRSLVTVHWTVASIFIGINTAALAFIANILSTSDNFNRIQWIILASGIASIGILFCLWLWLNRVNFLTHINNRRMNEIEQYFSMKMTIVKDALDIPEVRRVSRRKISSFPCIPSSGAWPIKIIYSIFILLWVAAMAATFIVNC